MIFGDPYKFAIQVDFVDAWNIDITDEGVFNFFVNGYYQPNVLTNQSLTILTCFDWLNSRYFYLKTKNIYPQLYNKNPEELYDYMNQSLNKIVQDESDNSEIEEMLINHSWLGIPEITHNNNY